MVFNESSELYKRAKNVAIIIFVKMGFLYGNRLNFQRLCLNNSKLAVVQKIISISVLVIL